MRPSDALHNYRDEIGTVIRRYRLRDVKVFGSVLDGTDHDGSDLDLLVEAAADTTLMDLAAAQLDLSKLLGLRVDLLTPGDLPASFREKVMNEARPL